jgi:hypothetical protein
MRLLFLLLLPISAFSASMNPDGYIGGWTFGADLSIAPSQKSRSVTLGEYRTTSGTDLSVDEINYTHSAYGLSIFAKMPTSEKFSFALGLDLLSELASSKGSGTYTPNLGNQVTSKNQTDFDTITSYKINIGFRYYFLP